MGKNQSKKKIEDIYPLSPMQRGMLFHSVYDPDSQVYSERTTFTIEGDIDLDAIEKAWGHLCQIHPLFRTIFRWEGLNEPIQVVLTEKKPEFGIHKFSSLDDDTRNKKIWNFLDTDKKKIFDLSMGPLMRLNIFLLGDNRYCFVWSYHHVLIDGWCQSLVMADLFMTYVAIVRGARLPDIVRPPYKNYIAWLKKQDIDASRLYWTGLLHDFNLATSIPTDHRPKDRSGFVVDKHTHCLSEEMTAALKDTAQHLRVTLSTLIQGAWVVLLSRYGMQDDVVYGVTISGRPAELQNSDDMIGLFINTLPIRLKITEATTLEELLKDIQSQSLKIQEYGYSFLPDVKACSNLSGATGLFNSIVVYENYPTDFQDMIIDDAVRIIDYSVEEMTNFDLTLIVVPGPQLALTLHYALALFNRDTIERMMGSMGQTLHSIIEDPSTKVSKLNILTSEEIEKVLVSFNDTYVPYPKDRCAYQLFEDQVEKTPERVAITFEEKSLTYRELNARANQLAHYLRKKGVARDSKVGILVDRSLDMVVGILGIHKAGGAYMPMDPEYPEARLLYMLKDSNSPVLVTKRIHADRLSNGSENRVLLDADWGEISLESEGNLDPFACSGDLSHLIYTSGSTGLPKGVMLEHKNVMAFLSWAFEEFSQDEYEEMIASTSICFDLSVFEFFLPLVTGARVIILRSPLDLDDYLNSNSATMINTVPSALKHLLSVAEKRHRVKAINLAGEPLMLELVQDAYRKLDVGVIRNLYGPTEDTTYSTGFRVPRDFDRQPLIGRPISNTAAYILDKGLKPVPIGVKGEIYLSGAGLARGYLNAPEKTAERFILNPYSGDGSSYIYKTGDLGKWLPDGNIEFHGRADYQVKIRGNRIEMGEIEACLLGHEPIKDAVVIDRDDAEGNKHLVAYYVSDAVLSITGLRGHLKEELPDYMIPSRFIHLEALPLTPNGKVDRKALPEADGLRPEMGAAYIAPRSELERVLAKVWQDILSIDRVGIYDNFFELGGHSLLIMKALAKLKLTYPITVQDFFDNQTIAELAERVSERLESPVEVAPAPMVEEETATQITVDIPISGQKESPKSVLLTGGTGYLGAHLLYELLKETNALIYCLIRGENQEHITQRLMSTLEFYFKREEMDISRITPVPGDLETDGLNLDDEMSKWLLKEVDTIVHCAADVRHFGEYSHFRNINVFGTKRLVDLASTGNCKRFHYISTLSVSGDYIPNMSQIVFKEADYDRGQVLDNVYARSKFEAEALVREAMGGGLNATIHRVGNLVGTSTTGKFQRSIDTNAFYGFIKAIVHMGILPDVVDGHIEMTPIDSCRKAIIELMAFPETSGRCLHVYNPNVTTLSYLGGLLKAFGYDIALLPAEEYLDAINRIEEDGGDALEKLVPQFTGDFFPSTRVIYDNRIASHFLDSIEFVWPPLDEELIHKLLNYCVSTGFIKPPVSREDDIALG